MAQSLNEFIAGLTWPFRGRRVVKDVERRLQKELNTMRWQELHAVRCQIEDAQSHSTHLAQALRAEIAILARQFEVFRQTQHDQFMAQEGRFQAQENHFHSQQSHLQTQQNYLQALEKLMRGNFTYLHDRIAQFEESGKAMGKDVSSALDQSAALRGDAADE
jgi:hypothetical protein